jgi:hypothetical protein
MSHELPADLLPGVAMEGGGLAPASSMHSTVGCLYMEPTVLLIRFK